MTRFRETSINKQISVVFMLILFISLLVSGTAFVLVEYYNNKNDLADQLTAVTKITASRSSAAFQFDDKETLSNILNSLQTINMIELACAYPENKQLLASYGNNIKLKCPNIVEKEGVHFVNNSVKIILPSIRSGSFVGSIFIQASLQKLTDRLVISILIMLLVTLITSIVAYLFLKKSQKIITEPILSLTKIADRIAANKDYYVPEIPVCAQEIATLFKAFANMLGNLQNKESELVGSESRLREILDNSLLSISIKDLDGEITYSNKHFNNFSLKTKRDSSVKYTINGLLSENEAHIQTIKDQQVFERDIPIKYETEITLDDDSYYFHIVKIPLHDNENHIYAICTISTDITETKKQAEQLKRSQKMDALGKLTGGIAHDYNNMLAVIIGYAQLVESASYESPKIQAFAQEIKKAGNRGAKLTSRLLAFSRTSAAEAKATDVSKLILNTRLMLEKTLTVRIRLNLELKDDIWMVNLDHDDLEDAILNLCINAMHAIEDSGELSICTNNITITDEDAKRENIPPGEYALIKISDTGCGMDTNVLEHIFDPFFSTKGEGGTGLGLSQVYGFVHRSGGSIKVESDKGVGSTFYLYFPHDSEIQIEDHTGNAFEEKDYKGTESILVVDDEPALVSLADEILTRAGYSVVTALNAEEALDVMESGTFDLLISDVIMPGMNGYALAIKVRKKHPKIKIQLVSGYDSNEPVSEEDTLLKNNMMNKPYGDLKLLRTIRTLLDAE